MKNQEIKKRYEPLSRINMKDIIKKNIIGENIDLWKIVIFIK